MNLSVQLSSTLSQSRLKTINNSHILANGFSKALPSQRHNEFVKLLGPVNKNYDERVEHGIHLSHYCLRAERVCWVLGVGVDRALPLGLVHLRV